MFFFSTNFIYFSEEVEINVDEAKVTETTDEVEGKSLHRKRVIY